MQNKGLDLLDYYNTQFDRDYLEFNVNIHDLEMNLQTFINRSFENITSTEHALNLLQQIQSILQRDTLKADLEAKYMIIFQNYGLDLDAVQKSYEKNKVLYRPLIIPTKPEEIRVPPLEQSVNVLHLVFRVSIDTTAYQTCYWKT